MTKRRKMLVADLLCGAGGSSTGCRQALQSLGLEMELVCLNHWPTAIETHTKNFPEARHYCQDISTVRPHIVVPEGYLDLLMGSPSCTHHSVARGGKPTSDQQRSDPWHIITWLTELRVKRMIIENVWEFINWGPVDPRTGKPIKSRKGEYFHAWIKVIQGLGFEPEWHKLNAADYGDATTRQRFILMARSDRKRVLWPVPTHAKVIGDKLELFPGMKPWKPARDIIDWDIKGKSIFGRKKALAPKTLARIYAGAVKFNWPEPFLVILRNHMDGKSVDGPVPTIAANGTHIGLAQPILLKQNFRRDAQSTDEPAPTIMTQARLGLAEPIVCGNRTNNTAKKTDEPVGGITTTTGGGQFLVEPVIMNGRKGNKAKRVSTEPLPTLDTKGGVWLAEPFVMAPGSTGAPRSADEPLPTITTGGAGADERQGCARPMMVEPFILNRSGSGRGETRAHSIDEPAPTATTAGAGYVIEPFIATVAHGNDADEANPNHRRVHSADDPLGTIHAGGGKFAVVEPFVMSRHSEGAPRSIDEPTPTQVAKHTHVLVAPYYSSGSGETCGSADDPLPTLTAKARLAMVVPLTHSDNANRARDDGEPLPTITTANRGELAFIAAQFGEREGQSPRVHDIENPTPAICATGHVNLVEATPEYDILFRMLEPHELAAAMGFNTEDAEYEFAGTKTEKIKQIGNAVSVAKMKACVSAIMADAADIYSSSISEKRRARA